MADPTWANVGLLLPLTGADNGTTFTDQSNSAHTVTRISPARTFTDAAAPGGSSMLIDDPAAGLHITGTLADFRFGTGDFTVEGFITPDDVITTQVIVHWSNSGVYDNGQWGILFDDTTGQPYWSRNDGGSTVSLMGSATPVTAAERVHYAYCRASGIGRLFLRGALAGSAADTTDYNSTTPTELSVAEYLGYGIPLLGRIGQMRICKEALYTSGFTPPTAEFTVGSSDPEGLIEVGSPLGAAAILAFDVFGRVSVDSPLGGAALLSQNVNGLVSVESPLGAVFAAGLVDFTGFLDGSAANTYVADMITPGGSVRVPISSWQATIRAGSSSYVQLVIPACTDLVDDITAATEFVIYKRAVLVSGQVIDYEMARAPATTLAFDQGPTNHTATVSGYADGLPESEDPPAAYDRTLTGIRSQHTGAGGIRIRCAVDWFLRPGQRAYVGTDPFVVGYINYYVPGFDQYMDVGEVNP